MIRFSSIIAAIMVLMPLSASSAAADNIDELLDELIEARIEEREANKRPKINSSQVFVTLDNYKSSRVKIYVEKEYVEYATVYKAKQKDVNFRVRLVTPVRRISYKRNPMALQDLTALFNRISRKHLTIAAGYPAIYLNEDSGMSGGIMLSLGFNAYLVVKASKTLPNTEISEFVEALPVGHLLKQKAI